MKSIHHAVNHRSSFVHEFQVLAAFSMILPGKSSYCKERYFTIYHNF
uniref:Uncharacterized protein n=1 Tax=Anopheles arabiensis TaxID=7173 RepID=A0A182HG50_ANOAR